MQTRDEVMQTIAAETDTILLAFSYGKDSIAAWLTLRESGLFKRIIPYYMWIVPGLQFVERNLAYYEQWFDQRVIRVPHLQFYKMLREMVFQPPERCEIIEACNLPKKYGYDEAAQLAAEIAGLPKDTWTAHGIRSADSPWRRTTIQKTGAINQKRRTFTPIADMKKDELIGLLKRHNIKLPMDYQWFGCSFDAIDYKFTGAIKRHAPDDYALIREWFPLVDLEVARYEGFDEVF